MDGLKTQRDINNNGSIIKIQRDLNALTETKEASTHSEEIQFPNIKLMGTRIRSPITDSL
jgi:hypothetical protein